MSKEKDFNSTKQMQAPAYCKKCGKELIDASKKYCPMCNKERFKNSKLIWYILIGIFGVVTLLNWITPDFIPIADEIVMTIITIVGIIINSSRKYKE